MYYRKKISNRSKWLLKKIALSACYLTREEIARAVKYVLSDYDKLAHNVILSIFGKLPCIQELKDATRKTLVLIIDEVSLQSYFCKIINIKFMITYSSIFYSIWIIYLLSLWKF